MSEAIPLKMVHSMHEQREMFGNMEPVRIGDWIELLDFHRNTEEVDIHRRWKVLDINRQVGEQEDLYTIICEEIDVGSSAERVEEAARRVLEKHGDLLKASFAKSLIDGLYHRPLTALKEMFYKLGGDVKNVVKQEISHGTARNLSRRKEGAEERGGEDHRRSSQRSREGRGKAEEDGQEGRREGQEGSCQGAQEGEDPLESWDLVPEDFDPHRRTGCRVLKAVTAKSLTGQVYELDDTISENSDTSAEQIIHPFESFGFGTRIQLLDRTETYFVPYGDIDLDLDTARVSEWYDEGGKIIIKAVQLKRTRKKLQFVNGIIDRIDFKQGLGNAVFCEMLTNVFKEEQLQEMIDEEHIEILTFNGLMYLQVGRKAYRL